MPSQDLLVKLRSIPEKTWIAVGAGVLAIALIFGIWTKVGGDPTPTYASVTHSDPLEGAPTENPGFETEDPGEGEEVSSEVSDPGQSPSARDDEPTSPAPKHEQESRTPPKEEAKNSSPPSGVPKDDISSRSAPSDDMYPGEHFPETRQKALDSSDISGWDYKKVRYAINEIFARRGANFKTDYIRREFEAKSWYKPVPGREAQNMLSLLTPVERENVKLLGSRRRTLEGMGAK